jgi:hypothetical protein
MSDVGENHFKDGKRLTEGCFPYMQYLSIHNPWTADKNGFHEPFFLFKMEIPSLRYLGTITFDVDIGRKKFCFDRSINGIF